MGRNRPVWKSNARRRKSPGAFADFARGLSDKVAEGGDLPAMHKTLPCFFSSDLARRTNRVFNNAKGGGRIWAVTPRKWANKRRAGALSSGAFCHPATALQAVTWGRERRMNESTSQVNRKERGGIWVGRVFRSSVMAIIYAKVTVYLFLEHTSGFHHYFQITQIHLNKTGHKVPFR